jgi:hypothetical protein
MQTAIILAVAVSVLVVATPLVLAGLSEKASFAIALMVVVGGGLASDPLF